MRQGLTSAACCMLALMTPPAIIDLLLCQLGSLSYFMTNDSIIGRRAADHMSARPRRRKEMTITGTTEMVSIVAPSAAAALAGSLPLE